MSKIDLLDKIPLKPITKIFELLSEIGESRLVGGCVRDIICGKSPQDIDIATVALPEQMLEIFSKHNVKAIPTGLKHGTITVVMDNHSFEVTTLRKDIECFGRHATVAFTDSWQEDASRRDFTVNAMFMDLEGKVYDYFGGLYDIKNNFIRFVGVAEKRVQEDYLRILRYFRFFSYFGGSDIDNTSLEAVIKYASHVVNLSGERIKKEMFKIATGTHAYIVIELMIKAGVWEYLGSEIPNLSKLKGYKFCDQPLVNLAAIICATPDPKSNCNTVKFRWRLSNKEITFLEMLCFKQFEFDFDNELEIARVLYFLGKDNFLAKLKLRSVEHPNEDLEKLRDFIKTFLMPIFPLKGDEIKKVGFKGKEISEIILSATNAWINSNFSLKKEELIELIKTCYLSRT